jgi:hypothetical protein
VTPEDAERRIRELEEELARERAETARYREAAYAFSRGGPFPDDDPMTEEEARRLTQDIDGRSIRDVLEELEREGA